MLRDEILKILLDWNFWTKDQEIGIEREEYKGKLIDLLDTRFIVSVIGVRRSGKSTIMRQVTKELSEKIGRENILFVNFEDERFTKLDSKILSKIYEIYLEEIKPSTKPVIFLDEIHRVENWEKWVRTYHELGKAKIIVSGSTSQIIKGELGTLLTGRHLDMKVYPLSFKEFLSFKNVKIRSKLELLEKESEVKTLLREYLEFGGFPEVVLEKKFKKEILRNYFDDIITKDVVERYKIRKIEELKSLTKFYLTNIGKYTTFSSTQKFLKLSKDTIENFSTYLSDVFLMFFVKMFDYSLKKQEKAPRKVYSIDVGLSNAIGFRVSENIGRLMENIVFIELTKMFEEIYYWKEYGKAEGKEVDFVIKEGPEIKQLIQVTYASGRDEVEEREIKSLIKASDVLSCKNLLVITWDYEGEEEVKGKKIRFVPLWKWLLGLG